MKYHLIGVILGEFDMDGWIYPSWILSTILSHIPTYFKYCPNCGTQLPDFKNLTQEERKTWAYSPNSQCSK